ncbi:hypothetical protein [Kamptonema formosum]|uniref:hypothetical protein n=1 Tax=Kamptonema formosum TaxID=331992 RepID=UPI00034AE349|nr:hypothetical protein [Oscillatoria sp. PCC 10802]
MVNPEADCGKLSNQVGADNPSFLERTNRLIEFLRKAEAAEVDEVAAEVDDMAAEVDDMAAEVDEVDENQNTEREKRKKILQCFQVIHQELFDLQQTQPESNFLRTFNEIMACPPPSKFH